MSELVQIKYINTHQKKHAVENPDIENNRRPDWLKVKLPTGENVAFLKEKNFLNNLNKYEYLSL